MRTEIIECWSFYRNEAAEIVDISDGQLANWIQRYGLFAEKQQGKGYHAAFLLKDLMNIEAMKLLIAAGIAPEKAAAALRPFGSIYGELLHDGGQSTRYPGTRTMTLSKDGKWIGADTPESPIAIEIRAWPIFDSVWPKFEAAVLRSPGAADVKEIRAALKAFRARIEDLRIERWEDRA